MINLKKLKMKLKNEKIKNGTKGVIYLSWRKDGIRSNEKKYKIKLTFIYQN